MATCEDWPCCGHERGCCPTFDESGKQVNMICVCGAELPVTSQYSLCAACLGELDEDEREFYDERDECDEGTDDDRF